MKIHSTFINPFPSLTSTTANPSPLLCYFYYFSTIAKPLPSLSPSYCYATPITKPLP